MRNALLLIFVAPFLFSCTSQFDKGTEAFELEQYEEAVIHYKKALEVNRNNWELYYNLGRSYEELNAFEEAKKWYRKALKINYRSPEIYLARARCYWALEDLPSAIMDLGTVINMEPNNFDALHLRGKVFIKDYNYRDAYFDLTEAVKINPEHISANYHLGLTKGQVGVLNGALKNFNFVIEEREGFGRAYYNRGIIQQRMQRYNRAISDFSEAIALDVKIADIYVRRGACQIELGRTAKACKDFGAAVRLDKQLQNMYREYCE